MSYSIRGKVYATVPMEGSQIIMQLAKTLHSEQDSEEVSIDYAAAASLLLDLTQGDVDFIYSNKGKQFLRLLDSEVIVVLEDLILASLRENIEVCKANGLLSQQDTFEKMLAQQEATKVASRDALNKGDIDTYNEQKQAVLVELSSPRLDTDPLVKVATKEDWRAEKYALAIPDSNDN